MRAPRGQPMRGRLGSPAMSSDFGMIGDFDTARPASGSGCGARADCGGLLRSVFVIGPACSP